MKHQLELPMLAIVSKDNATTWNLNTPRKSAVVSYDLASRRGSVTVAELRGSHGSCYMRIYDKRGVTVLYPVQMCLDLSTPRT